MHPRTVAILAGSILAVALVLRVVIYQAGLLPLSEEIVLKKATSLTVSYKAGKPKTLTITDPEQLADLFSVLELYDPKAGELEDNQRQLNQDPTRRGGLLKFGFPGGRSRLLLLAFSNWLGYQKVNPRFHAKLCALVSRAEGGRHIELIAVHDPAAGAEKAAEP